MRMNHATQRSAAALKFLLWIEILIGVLLLTSCSSQPQAQQAQQAEKESSDHVPAILAPADWRPSLDQVQEDVEEAIAARPNQSQQALNKASRNLADLVDARLFITYTLLLQRLDEKSSQALIIEQKAWLTQRETAARAAVVSKGGSLEPLEYASAFGDITKKRLKELEARLAQLSKQAGTTPGRGEQ